MRRASAVDHRAGEADGADREKREEYGDDTGLPSIYSDGGLRAVVLGVPFVLPHGPTLVYRACKRNPLTGAFAAYPEFVCWFGPIRVWP
jgi:hypothetical protein